MNLENKLFAPESSSKFCDEFAMNLLMNFAMNLRQDSRTFDFCFDVTRILLTVVTHAFTIPQDECRGSHVVRTNLSRISNLYTFSYCGRNGLHIWLSTTSKCQPFHVYGLHLSLEHSRGTSSDSHKENLSEFKFAQLDLIFGVIYLVSKCIRVSKSETRKNALPRVPFSNSELSEKRISYIVYMVQSIL